VLDQRRAPCRRIEPTTARGEAASFAPADRPSPSAVCPGRGCGGGFRRDVVRPDGAETASSVAAPAPWPARPWCVAASHGVVGLRRQLACKVVLVSSGGARIRTPHTALAS
jgi:hypothetical protein